MLTNKMYSKDPRPKPTGKAVWYEASIRARAGSGRITRGGTDYAEYDHPEPGQHVYSTLRYGAESSLVFRYTGVSSLADRGVDAVGYT